MKKIIGLLSLLFSGSVMAGTVISLNAVDQEGTTDGVGTVKVSETPHGLVFTPDLQGLETGLHGFHLHQNADCGPAEKDGKMVPALAAGSHYDPRNTGKHGTPWGEGHRGDLPALYVDEDGNATQPVLAPRVRMSDLPGRALMIHANGDNYSDDPKPLGGGGARVACGIVD